MKYFLSFLICSFSVVCAAATNSQLSHSAQAIVFPAVQERTHSIGTVSFQNTDKGLKVSVNLSDLPAGEHGLHVHQYPDCSPKWENGQLLPAGMAGGHYDPDKTNRHLGPNGGGHRGDLPPLVVQSDGSVNTSFVVPHLTVDDVKNRSIVVHQNGDNFSDVPLPEGGSGGRIACGIIK